MVDACETSSVENQSVVAVVVAVVDVVNSPVVNTGDGSRRPDSR